jgi:tetratricopeptide (TPR) repeat protein
LEGLVSSGTSRIPAYSLIAWLLGDVKHNYEKALSILRDATPRFSKDKLFINSLAYIHLMLGQAQDARALLEKETLKSNDLSDVALTATWGLLYLREGNHEKARDLYRSAATLASQFGNKELADIVRQKMHLEFANEALKMGNRAMGLNEVNQGLAVVSKGNKMDYSADLASLKRKLMEETAKRS